MIKAEIKLTQEQIRERTNRAGMRPYIAHIIDLDTHVHVYYLVFAENSFIAIDSARQHGAHAPGSAGQASPVETAFITHQIPQAGRLIYQDADAPCIVSTVEPGFGGTPLDTIARVTTVNGNLEQITVQ